MACCFSSLHSQVTLALCRAAVRAWGSAGEPWSGGSFPKPFCVALFLLPALLELQGFLQEHHSLKQAGSVSQQESAFTCPHQLLFPKRRQITPQRSVLLAVV